MNCKSKLRGAIVLTIIFFLTSILPAYSQLRWDGGGGDGQWTTVTNWAGDILPSSIDSVLLDNSLVTGNYTVVLPAGMQTVTLQSLVIQPLVGNSIELILPVAN